MTDQPSSPGSQRLVDEVTGKSVHLVYAVSEPPFASQPQAAEDFDLPLAGAQLWAARWLIIMVTLAGGILGIVWAMLLPVMFQSQVVALPPQSKQAGGGLAKYADLAAMSGIALPGGGEKGSVEEILAILDSRTLRQKLIADFNFKDTYGAANDDDALARFSKHFSSRHDKKTNCVIFSFLHTDPQVAANLCNAAAIALQERFNEVHQSASRRQREFLETRLKIAQQESAVAAKRFADFQRENQAIELESQTKATIEAIGTLQGQLIVEQVELRALLATAVNVDNPQVQLLQQKVDELGRVLTRMTGTGDQEGVFIGLGRVPALGAQYLILFRDVKRSEAMVEILISQAEGARMAEVRSGEIISIIDTAVPAQRKSSPKRAQIGIIGSMLGGMAAIGWTLTNRKIRDFIRIARSKG